MSAQDEVWILGINMTKFGKHPERDVVDLGRRAVGKASRESKPKAVHHVLGWCQHDVTSLAGIRLPTASPHEHYPRSPKG